MVSQTLETSKSERKVWLVKVPNFLADTWEQAFKQQLDQSQQSNETSQNQQKLLGKILKPLKRKSSGSQPQNDDLTLILEDELAKERLPKKYRLTKHTGELPRSHIVSELNNRFAIEGRISQQYDIQADIINGKIDPKYLEMLRERRDRTRQKDESNLNKIELQTDTQAARSNYIPLDKISVIKKKNTNDNRRGRMDRPKLISELFKIFEQYTRMPLQQIQVRLNQPLQYLKEVLSEIAVQNKKGPYKDLWELKRELRNDQDFVVKKEETHEAVKYDSDLDGDVKMEKEEL